MARRTKRQIMAGVDCISSHLIDNNTVEYETVDGERVIRLHLTDIVTYKNDGSVLLNTGGWNTVTTRDRINNQLEQSCPGWRMYSEKNEPYLIHGSWSNDSAKRYHFHDGIVITGDTCSGKEYDKELVKKAAAWQRKIKRYAKKFTEKMIAGEIPAPSGGDCWMCSFVDDKDRAWGELSGHDDHVISHVIEEYYVPSLVVRATKQFGVAPVAESCLAATWGDHGEEGEKYLASHMAGFGWEQIEKAIYRYCIQWAPYNEEAIARIEAESEAAS